MTTYSPVEEDARATGAKTQPAPQELWQRYHQTGDAGVENALVEQYLPLVDKSTQKLPGGRYPKCPNCGGPMFLNVRGGGWFVEAPWIDGSNRYKKWLAGNKNKKLVVLDIGSGFNTPMWVRWPAEETVRINPVARLLRLNLHHPEVPEDIQPRSLSFSEPAEEILGLIAALMPGGTKG